jgi:transposase
MDAMTVAIDLAKDIFEVAISDGQGRVHERRRLKRRQFATFVDTLPSDAMVVMEACGSSHYWARRCQARGAMGRLLSPQYVRPYVRRNKTDRTDAEALLEANRCGSLLAVPVKTVEQQMIQAVHRLRQQWQITRTARINFVRALLREQGIVFPVRTRTLQRQIAAVIADPETPLSDLTRQTASWVLEDLEAVDGQLKQLDRRLAHIARTHPIAGRLQQIPGIGVVTSTALVGSVPHIHAFRRGRQFASWLGLTPREHSSGQRRVLGGISKHGDVYLRSLLAHGARAFLRGAEVRATQSTHTPTRLEDWAVRVAARRGRHRAILAIANKLARIIWAVWHHDRDFGTTPATLEHVAVGDPA